MWTNCQQPHKKWEFTCMQLKLQRQIFIFCFWVFVLAAVCATFDFVFILFFFRKSPEKPKLRLNWEIPTSVATSMCHSVCHPSTRELCAENYTYTAQQTSQRCNYHLDANATRTSSNPKMGACDNRDVDWTVVAAAMSRSSNCNPISRFSGNLYLQ